MRHEAVNAVFILLIIAIAGGLAFSARHLSGGICGTLDVLLFLGLVLYGIYSWRK